MDDAEPASPSDLARVPTAWLTTVRPDGSPHTTPIWFVVDGERIWMASSTVNKKVQFLAADPRCSFALDGSGMEPHVAEGTVTIHPIDVRADVIDALAAKYRGWDATDEAQDGPRVLLELVVDRWLLGGPPR
jgi:PPOX class probable F420-dependent enzyme